MPGRRPEGLRSETPKKGEWCRGWRRREKCPASAERGAESGVFEPPHLVLILDLIHCVTQKRDMRLWLGWLLHHLADAAPPPTRRPFLFLNRVTPSYSARHLASAAAAPLDFRGLKRETQRRLLRANKKIAKKSARLVDLKPDSLEHADCQQSLLDAQAELIQLEALRELLDRDREQAIQRALELGVRDSPPDRPPRQRKDKVQALSPGPRKPYWRFESLVGVEIRVGRSAQDNDLLSLLPEHRDPDDVWMHASGYPGSHVIARCQTLDDDTELDAACLAALYSKAVPKPPADAPPHAATGKAVVTICRARCVSKPPGAKPGLVRLNGDVYTVRLDLAQQQSRLQRLLATKCF